MTRYLLLFDSYDLIFVERRLWREDGSVFCRYCWSLPGAVFLGSILLSPIWDFPFRRLLRLAGSRWRYSVLLNWTLLYNHFARAAQKTQPVCCWEGVFTEPLQRKLLDCCLHIRYRGNMFIESLLSNERLFWRLVFRLSGVMSHYVVHKALLNNHDTTCSHQTPLILCLVCRCSSENDEELSSFKRVLLSVFCP
jgi:hypothetical protein